MPTLPSTIETQIDTYPAVVPYASVNFSDEFLGTRISTRAFWMALPDDQTASPGAPIDKESALKEATEDLDNLYYQGTKILTGTTSMRKWPRYIEYGTFPYLYSYLEQTLPIQVAMACCLQAYYLAYNAAKFRKVDERLDLQSQGVFSTNRAGASETSEPRFARQHRVCRQALLLLRNFIAKTATLRYDYTVDGPGRFPRY